MKEKNPFSSMMFNVVGQLLRQHIYIMRKKVEMSVPIIFKSLHRKYGFRKIIWLINRGLSVSRR